MFVCAGFFWHSVCPRAVGSPRLFGPRWGRDHFIFFAGGREGEAPPPGSLPAPSARSARFAQSQGWSSRESSPAGRGGGDPLQRRERARPPLPPRAAAGARARCAHGRGSGPGPGSWARALVAPRPLRSRGRSSQHLLECHGARRSLGRGVGSLLRGCSCANSVFSFMAETMAAQREWSPMVSSRWALTNRPENLITGGSWVFDLLFFILSLLQSNWNEIVDNFDDMNLKESLLRGIYAYGFEKPSAIQQRAIIPCIKGMQ